MAEDNITPIRGGIDEEPEPEAKRVLPLRDDSSDSDGFTTLDLVNGLHGVCLALDELFNDQADINHAHELAMAAKILSAMLADRLPGARS
jgi:hypothetical protein